MAFAALLAAVALIWYISIGLIAAWGWYIIQTKFRLPPNVNSSVNSTSALTSAHTGSGPISEPGSASASLPGVTILRPISGFDAELLACLECSFLQTYPHKQIIFCFDDSPHPAAVAAVTDLCARYPHVDSLVLHGYSADLPGPNPKVGNLFKGYQAAKYDILWVLDSNVWASHGTLERAVQVLTLEPGIGHVHHLPIAIPINAANNPGLGAQLDSIFLSTAHAKFYCAINSFRVAPCVNGKSNLFSRAALDRAVKQLALSSTEFSESEKQFYSSEEAHRGLGYFARVIGEDNMIADVLWHYGAKSRTFLTNDVVVQPEAPLPLRDYIGRRVRWLRVRKYMVVAATLVEPATECLLLGSFGTYGFSWWLTSGAQRWSWLFFFCHVAVWLISDVAQCRVLHRFRRLTRDCVGTERGSRTRAEGPSRSTPNSMERGMGGHTVPWFIQAHTGLWSDSAKGLVTEFVVPWLLREVLALPVWLYAMSGESIVWRGRRFRIRWDLSTETL